MDTPALLTKTCFISFAALLLSACVHTRPPESPKFRDVVPVEAVSINDETTTPFQKESRRSRSSINMLAISGGGSFGAFGAGVLKGWSESGKRPKFDIVTGVSTGALIAIYAFLGPQHDNTLEKLYTAQTKKDIYRNRGITGFFSDSLYDNFPLKKQIERSITPEMLNAIAVEHRKGRRLYIATTNIDSGQLVIWDMGRIAIGGRANDVQFFQKVVRASTSIPGFFKPVYIKPLRGVQVRQAHVDGGIKAPVVLSDFLFRGDAPSRNLFVIVNDSMSSKDTFKAVKPSVLDVAKKSISTMSRRLMQETVYHGYVRASRSKTNFYLTSIPPLDYPNINALDFEPKVMKQLYQAGRRKALAQNSWSRRPQTVQVIDRID